MWLIVLAWLRRAWPALAVCVVLAVLSFMCQYSYMRGKADCDRVWQERAARQQSERLRELRDVERRAREAQDAITAGYVEDIALLRAEHERQLKEVTDDRMEIVNAFSPVCAGGTYADGVCRCQSAVTGGDSERGVSAGTGDKSRVACYSEDRLRRQIAESVALGQECDKEMMRFKALIEACRPR